MEQHKPQRLPLEVQFLILDEVPRISQTWVVMRNSLRSCALACQAWLPNARQHLYHAVYLDNPWQTPLLARTLTESPDIGPLIKHLHIPCFSYIVVNDYPEPLPSPGYLPLAAAAVSRLSSLRSVAFKVPPGAYAPPFMISLIGSFSVLGGLESLSVHNAILQYPGILHLLWSFPALRSVELDNCQWYRTGQHPDVDAYPNRYRDLRDLKIRKAVRVAPYLELFSEAVKLTSILLWRHTLGHHDHYDGLRMYTQLQALDLGTCNWNVTWMVDALSNVQSDKMDRLTLTLRSHETPLETVIQHWSASGLDDVLSAAPFLGLRQLDLNFLCADFSQEVARNEIVRIFPQCHERGILRLHTKPYEPA